MKINSISDLALTKIKPGMTISLGGGSNVFNLAKAIAINYLDIVLCSPSEITRLKGRDLGLNIQTFDNINHIDLAFDGCDSVDYRFNALKSMGGIHLFEKIAAQMADEFVLLLPYERIKKELDAKIPLCLEVAPPCAKQIQAYLKSLQLNSQIRQDSTVAAYSRSPLGNYLLDVHNENWHDIAKLNAKICRQNGGISSSLFEGLVTSLITKKDSKIIEFKKGDL